MRIITALVAILCLSACTGHDPEENNDSEGEASVSAVPVVNYSLKASHPHDTNAFTEGLLVHDGRIWESTGATSELPQTRSLFGIVDPATGVIDRKAELDREKYFGEGIVFLRDKIYQLTYRTQEGFIYDAKTFKQTGTFTFPSKEGWGMTTDGRYLIMSDGTSSLTWLDPDSFKTVRTLNVTSNGSPVLNLNELELIHGFIWANVYTTTDVVKIDTATGKVVGKLDLSSLAFEARTRFPGSLEMNGIAWDAAADKVYVTGKMWPDIYEISFPH